MIKCLQCETAIHNEMPNYYSPLQTFFLPLNTQLCSEYIYTFTVSYFIRQFHPKCLNFNLGPLMFHDSNVYAFFCSRNHSQMHTQIQRMQKEERLSKILNKRLPPSFSTGVTDKMLDRILGEKCFFRENQE